ncbi:hypothetical protein DICPUDRAFT_99651 [Dictyostelium purpureum]|uniref:CNH domain-containing protein n=1 Tax=Dictyostelium purpureum TaxID=5786 RepID=F1A193_DICPU|nr:uncharacterized protein DICPUDRAFT_99651 [Dictyostelium purpureum]EGC30043.1 hypothetical protein DICPUDRAFT_99651 [Dictyostelium purpureum]|eukprot:XP_003293430.1 hypothetical protein DICPUDRAFT_99651 [Dictyostelium purpureum]
MNPFELIPIVNNVPSKIESIEIWANNIYLGTNDGQVFLYIIERVENNKKITFKSRMEKRKSLNHGKKPVEKLLLMSDIGKLLTLCDGNVDVLSMYNLESTNQQLLPTSKGVIAICSKKKSPEYKICVVTKKKLTFYEFVGVFEMYKEIVLPDVAMTVEWCKNSICIGSKKEYAILDVDKENYRSLLTFDKNQTGQSIKLIVDQERLLLTHANFSFMVDLEGEIKEGSIPWDSHPISMAYIEPYLISLTQNKNILIHDMKDQHSIQELNTISQSNNGKASGQIQFNQVFEGRGDGKDFIVLYSSNPNAVYCLHLGNIDDIVNTLVTKGENEEAIRLFEIFFKRERSEFEDTYDPKKEELLHKQRLSKVYEKVALSEFFKFKFQSSFKYLSLATMVDHRSIISFFPTYMPYQTNYRSLYDPNDIFKLINEQNSLSQSEKESLITEAKENLTIYLENHLNKLIKDPAGKISDENKDITTILLKLYAQTNNISKFMVLLTRSRLTIINTNQQIEQQQQQQYQHQRSQSRDYNLNQQQQPQQQPININNQFFVQDIEEWLNGNKLFKHLGIIFQYTEKYRKALLLWNKLSIKELGDPFNSDGIEDSVSLLESKNNDILPEPSKELIWEFAPFLLKKSPETAMRIFLKKRKDSLAADDVIEFLLPFGEKLYQQYLEYLIFQEDNKQDYLHTRLATSYIDQVFNNSPDLSTAQGRVDTPEPNEDRLKLIDLLEYSNCYNASTLLNRIRNSLLYEELVILYLRIGQYEMMFNIIIWKLNDFKKAEYICVSFDPQFSLSNVASPPGVSPSTSNSNSPALQSAQSTYRQSVRLSTNLSGGQSSSPNSYSMFQQQGTSPSNINPEFQKNLPKASLYDPKRQELFLCLLKTYLSFKEQAVKINNQLVNSMIKDSQKNGTMLPKFIIEFLNNYYNEMDPIKVIQLLPNSIPIHAVDNYLAKSFNFSISQQRESKIVCNLQKCLNIQTRAEFLKISSASVLIGTDKRCNVCSKPIGDRVFVYFPNGTIVHPKCYQFSYICPVSRTDFKLNPIEYPYSI